MGKNPFVPNNSKDGVVPLRAPSNREPAMVGTSSVSGTINVPLPLSLSLSILSLNPLISLMAYFTWVKPFEMSLLHNGEVAVSKSMQSGERGREPERNGTVKFSLRKQSAGLSKSPYQSVQRHPKYLM